MPLVTLADGHVFVMLRFFGVEDTKGVALQYANELLAVHTCNQWNLEGIISIGYLDKN